MVVKHNAYHPYIWWILLIGLSFGSQIVEAMSMYNRNDPWPIYKTLDPQFFLLNREKQILKGYAVDTEHKDRVLIAISPFAQRATIGKNICGDYIQLGNLDGKWAMVGLLQGGVPEGQELPPSLLQAREVLYPDEPAGAVINDPFGIDKNQMCGFFEIPAKYRKYGVRINFEAQITNDIGISLDFGLADICFTTTNFDNLTINDTNTLCSVDVCHCDNENFTRKNINEYLMCPYECILQEIGYDISNFHKASAENFRAYMYWRHAYPINSNRDEWMDFLLIPFFKVGGTVSTDQRFDYNEYFALPFGDKNFNSIGFTGGLNVDFADTVELGGEAGLTHFFGKDCINMHVPTSKLQSGIYPFKTDVSLHPGDNWHFTAKMNAYHFLGNLSCFFQYVLVIHQEDEICLRCPDPDKVFKPELLESRSTFKVQVANIGFNYDISPNISLGFLWQAPLAQKNAFRSTTVMVGFNAVF